MRTKLFRFLIMAFLVVTTATSCFDGLSADVSESDVRKGRKFTTAMCAAPMQNEFETKSLLGSRSDAAVYNWNLFVFDGGVLVGKYYKSSGEDIEFDVKLDHFYEFMAVANVGNKTNLFGAGATKTEVAALELTDVSSGYSTNGLPMAWASSSPIQFTKAQYDSHTASLDIQMTRLTGKYQIAVNKHGLNKWSFRVKSLVMKGASSIRPFSSSANAATSYSTVSDQATAADITLLQTFDNMDVSSPAVFYPLENVMDTPSSLSGNSDPWNKVQDRVPGNKYPTYVEMVAEAALQDGSGITKDVTYRFYLGYNATNDFRVVRNVSHSLTFYPDDESITNGHMGNWKITPGPFDDTRDLDFARQTTADTRHRVRAGTSDVESIVKVPSALKYVVKKSTDNITVKNTSTGAVIANNTVTDASFLTLDIAAGVKQTAEVTVETIDGALSDVLHLDIFNAYLEITDPVPAVRNWGWNTYGTLSAQTFTVRTSVDFTMTAPSGWSASKSLVSDTGGEKIWTITVYPEGPCAVETAPGESLSLVFRNSEIDDVTATLTRDFKPVLSVDNDNLTWFASKAGENDGINVSVTSNESWTVTKASGWDDNKWGISSTSGSGNGTIKVWPKTVNATIPPVDVTTLFTILPNRGTDAEKATVNMTHQKPAVNLDITEDGNSWPWKSTDAFTFHVTGNVNWQASLSNTEKWEFVGASTGSGNGTVTVRPKAQNLSVTDLVSGTLSLACTDAGITVTPAPTASLQQGVHPNVALSSSDNLQWAWNATDAKGITLTLSPEGYGWQAQLVNGEASHWQMTENHTNNTISIQPTGVNDDVNNTLSVQVRITATDPDDSQSSAVVTCTHNKREPYFYFMDPTQQNLSWRWYENASNTVVVNFSTSETWSHTVSSGSAYFSATNNGNSLTIAPVGANTDGARNGTISIEVVGHPELNKTITLSQEAKPTVSVVPTGYDWAWTATSADAQNFTVTCTSGYTWSASKTDADNKFSLSGATGVSGAAFVAGPVGTNEDTEKAYSATIIVTLVNSDDPHAGDITATVTMNHEKKTSNFITATPGSLIFDDLANSDAYKQQITVSSNGAWSFDLPSGYNASTTSGSGNGSFYIWPTSKNNTYEDKSVTMTINGPGGVSANVTLIHEAIQRTLDHYEFSVSPSSFSLEWPGTTQSYSENIYPSITAVYISEHYDYSYEDEWVDGWTVDNISGNVGSHGEWSQPNTYSYRLTATNTNDTDWPSGTITLRYTGSSFPSLSGATASSSWEIQGKPTISLSPNSMTWDWDQSGNISGVRRNPNISSSGNDYFHPDNLNFVFTSNPGNIFDRGFYGIYPTSQNTSTSSRSGSGKISYEFHGVTIESNEITLTQTGKPAGPTYTYTLAVKESGGDYGTNFEVSATGTLVLEAWLTQRFTNGSSTPDAGFTPVNVTSDVVWEPDATLSSWSSCSSGTVSAHATSEPSDKVGVYTVTYGAAVNSPVDVYIDVVDELISQDYRITLDGDESPVTLDYGETVEAKIQRKLTYRWAGESGWSTIASASCGVYDMKNTYSISRKDLVKEGVVSKSGYGTVTIRNTNETGAEVTGYAYYYSGREWSEAITLKPKPVVTTIYKVVTKGKKVGSDDDPSSTVAIYDNESVELSATLYSSDDNGNTWTVGSSFPSSYSRVSGYNVINTSTGGAISTGTGVYRGTFTGDYDISSYSDVTITVSERPVPKIYKVETRVNNESSYEATFGNGLSLWYSYLVPLSAKLYSSTDGGYTWTEVSSSPDSFVMASGTSVLDLSYDPAHAVARGTGFYRGVFNGYTIASNSDVKVTVHEINYSNFSIAFDREWFAVGKSTKVHAYIDRTYDGTTTNIEVTDDAQFSVLAGALSISGNTVTSTGNYYEVCSVRGTYGSLQADASVVVNSLIDLVFDSSDYHFGSLSTINTVDVIGKWSGGQEIPITEYFPFEIVFNNWVGNHDFAGRVTWSVPSFDGTKYSSMPSLSISRPTEYHSNYVKTAAGRYDFPVSVRVPTFGKSYDLNAYINLVEQDIDYSPKTIQSGIQMIASFSVRLGLDGSGESWNYVGSNPIYVDYTWGNYPPTSYGNWNIYHSSGSNQLDIRYSGSIDNEGQVEREIQIGRQEATVWKFKVYVDMAGSQGTHIQIVSAGVVE